MCCETGSALPSPRYCTSDQSLSPLRPVNVSLLGQSDTSSCERNTPHSGDCVCVFPSIQCRCCNKIFMTPPLRSAFIRVPPFAAPFLQRTLRCPSPPQLTSYNISSIRRITMTHTPAQSFYRRQLPNNLIDLKSAEGKKRFKSALENGDAEAFFPLVSQFQTQSHPALCGLTTLTTVLNALEIDPKRVWTHPWRWFAESLLECCLNMEAVKATGITMDQLACTAGCQGSIVDTFRGLSIDQARDLIRKSVRGRPDGSFEFVVAAYDRRSLGQTGSGHFSPIAAIDLKTDTVLVLDVARFKVRCCLLPWPLRCHYASPDWPL